MNFIREFSVAASILLLTACGGGGEPTPGGGGSQTKYFTNYQDASVVVGAADMTSLGTFMDLFGNPAVDPDGKVYVSDYGASKTFVYSSLPTGNGVTPTLVLDNNGTTAGEGGNDTVLFHDGKMILVEYSNSRILIWNTAPTANGTPPDAVVGQPTADDYASGCTAAKLAFPESANIVAGNLVVADSGNNRVLVYDGIPATGASAVAVLGQSSFGTCTINGPGVRRGLRYPSDIAYDGQRLIVADTDNNRVLMWNTSDPRTLINNPSADIVLGQSSLDSVYKNSGTTSFDGTPDNGLRKPYFLAVSHNRLAVADADNNRVLIWDNIPTCEGVSCPASFGSPVVLGQPDLLTTSGLGFGNPTAKSIEYPTGLKFTTKDQLIVLDNGGKRVLIFDAR